MSEIHDRVRKLLHANVVRGSPLSGGCVADVRHLTLEDGRDIVAKVGTGVAPGLALEGFMLEFLGQNSRLPVPQVLFADDDLLLMTFVPGGEMIGPSAQEDAAHHVAALHDVTAPDFGFSCDTLIGGLSQPNSTEHSWLTFFRDHRLLYMGREANNTGRLSVKVLHRLEAMCAQLDKWLTEPAAPSLLHGDMWTGNILVNGGKISGFVDPAIYFGDPEIELAFTTLFGTFDDAFFRTYQELRGMAPGFFEERRDIYNLYPLLVHVRLFGGSYVQSVEQTLRRFGY
jgi:fructosamine-3-kinase